MVQPFIQFPPQQHDEKGVQACHTEDKLDHNHLGNKSVEVTLTDCNYDNPWPVDQTFFIYIISKTHGGATRIKSFENMLLQAIRQMTSGLQYKFEFKTTFDEDEDEDRCKGQYINISFEQDGYDYTCGTGTRIYNPTSEEEPNVVLGSKYFQKLISPNKYPYPNDKKPEDTNEGEETKEEETEDQKYARL